MILSRKFRTAANVSDFLGGCQQKQVLFLNIPPFFTGFLQKKLSFYEKIRKIMNYGLFIQPFSTSFH